MNYQKYFKLFFGGINSNIKFLVLTVVKHVILSYFLIGFQKEFSYEASLDKTDVVILQSLHGQPVGFDSLQFFLKILQQ